MRATAIAVGVAGVLAIAAAWGYSHVAPDQFGSCHTVALYVGSNPTIRDCEPFEAADFAVPLALVAIAVPLLLVLSDEGDTQAEIPLPSYLGGGLLVTRRGKAAARELDETAPSLAERGSEFLQTLPDEAEEGSGSAGEEEP